MLFNQIHIPNEVPLRLDIFSLLILLGIFQGVFLVYFFLNKKNRKVESNVFSGLFLIVLSLNITEVFLNYTGFIQKIVWINDFSEPGNFLMGPLLFFYIKTSLNYKFQKKDIFQFLPFLLYLIYFQFYFLQPWQEKYNSFIWAFHPDLNYIPYTRTFSPDPLLIRSLINELTFIHLLIYCLASIKTVSKALRKEGISFFGKTNAKLAQLRLFSITNLMSFSIFVIVKIVFHNRDMGDKFIASFITIIIYIISFYLIKHSVFFATGSTSEEENKLKYQKSSLSKSYKNDILLKITELFETEKYYLNSLVSLPSLSKKIGESQHHVSQVINELLNQSFFEMIAQYRIDEAKKILLLPQNQNLTIEELAEKVGYNSKSAFNKAFKKYTGLTPSQFKQNSTQSLT